jgi:hypothetical protein
VCNKYTPADSSSSTNDFSKNLKTIRAEQALVQFVSANDTQVLVKGVMADALELITAA